MDVFSPLNIYGAAIVTAMVVFYAIEGKATIFTFLFGIMCIGTSAYGFLAGTWPFGVIEAVWAVIAFRKYFRMRTPSRSA